MNGFYRAFFSLATIIPVFIPFAYINFVDCSLSTMFGESWVWPIVLSAVLLILVYVFGMLLVKILAVFCKRKSPTNISMKSIKPLGGDSMLGYLPYVLPLFVAGSGFQNIFGWVLGIVVLFLLAWSSMTITYSPLLRICGVRFYEVITSEEEKLLHC